MLSFLDHATGEISTSKVDSSEIPNLAHRLRGLNGHVVITEIIHRERHLIPDFWGIDCSIIGYHWREDRVFVAFYLQQGGKLRMESHRHHATLDLILSANQNGVSIMPYAKYPGKMERPADGASGLCLEHHPAMRSSSPISVTCSSDQRRRRRKAA